MASGFLNSAGTDLDSLFYTDNGNAGALGFLVSGGQDLGNRYTKASTLGYNVGYKNSAGTDIGYLRGAVTIPTVASYNVTRNNSWHDPNELCTWDCTTDSEGSTSCSSAEASHNGGYLTITATAGNWTGTCEWYCAIALYHTEGSTHAYEWVKFNIGSTSVPSYTNCSFRSGYSLASGVLSKRYVVSDWVSGGASRTLNVGYINQGNRSGTHDGYNQWFRIYHRFRTSAGTSAEVYQDIKAYAW